MKALVAPVLAALALAMLAAPTEAVVPDYKFVAMPDFLNADNADVSDTDFWKPGDPNSINDSYRTNIGEVLDDVAAYGATDVLVPGDLVEGRWGRDDQNTGIFGPVGTTAEKVRAVQRAAGQYYSAWHNRFTNRGLTVHAGVGDHEIGDNGWSATGGGYAQFKYDNLDVFKAEFAERFTNNGTRYADRPVGTNFETTAYAKRLSPEVQLVTMDVFVRNGSTVVPEVGSGELAWMKDVLARANADGVDWIIVQAHTPVVGPVRMRGSSGLMYQGGAGSAFWQAMKDAHVDLYLAGEVHDTTAITPEDRGVSAGPVQVSTGGLYYAGNATYMTGEVVGDTLALDVREFDATRSDVKTDLWQTQRWDIQPNWVNYKGPSFSVGSMTLTKDGLVLTRTGKMAKYTP